MLDRPRLALEPGGVPVDLAGVQHGVAALADVDERRLHARQHVLHPAEVDVADVGRGAGAGDVVLDEHAVLEHGDLGAVAALAHDHDPVDRLAAGQELGLGEDRRAAAAGLAAVAAALALGLQPGRALDAPHAVVASFARGLAHVHDGVRRVVGLRDALGALGALGDTPAAPAPAPRRRGLRGVVRGLARRFGLGGVGRHAVGLRSTVSSLPGSAASRARPRPRRPRRRRRRAPLASSAAASRTSSGSSTSSTSTSATGATGVVSSARGSSAAAVVAPRRRRGAGATGASAAATNRTPGAASVGCECGDSVGRRGRRHGGR